MESEGEGKGRGGREVGVKGREEGQHANSQGGLPQLDMGPWILL